MKMRYLMHIHVAVIQMGLEIRSSAISSNQRDEGQPKHTFVNSETIGFGSSPVNFCWGKAVADDTSETRSLI